MTDNKHIDEQFRLHRNDWDERPANAVWDRLTDRLDEHRGNQLRRRRSIYRISAAASVAILMTLSIYMFNHSYEPGGFQAEQVNLNMPDETDMLSRRGNTDQGEYGTSGEAVLGAASGSRSRESQEDVTIERTAEAAGTTSLYEQDHGNSISGSRYKEESSQLEISKVPDVIAADEAEYSDEDEVSYESVAPSVTWLSKRNREEGWSADPTEPDPAEKEEKDVADRGHQEEPGELIDVAVANAIGMDAVKEKHEQEKQRSRGAGTKAATQGRIERTDVQTTAGSADLEFSSASDAELPALTVLVPVDGSGNCDLIAFRAVGEQVFIDRCADSANEPETDLVVPIRDLMPILKARTTGLDAFKAMETAVQSGPCLPSANNVQLIFDTPEAASDRNTARLPVQEFCLTEAVRPIIRELVELAGQYSQ